MCVVSRLDKRAMLDVKECFLTSESLVDDKKIPQ